MQTPFFAGGLFFGQRMRFFAANTAGVLSSIPKTPRRKAVRGIGAKSVSGADRLRHCRSRRLLIKRLDCMKHRIQSKTLLKDLPRIR